MTERPILDNINNPADVRGLDEAQLAQLCGEIRSALVETVSQTGGHLASGLGAVELTVALHKCFDSPKDSIIWDVGHQAYAHKLLTGRRDRFSTLRQKGGISGFTRPDESEHDIFYSGHAGVSVSQAAGVACANALKGNRNYAVAVIGDGSFTGGMVYEAMDAVGFHKTRLIVVLNDNEMSISQNVGSLARHLARVRAKPEYYRFKAGAERTLNRIPVVGRSMSNHLFRLKTALKNLIYSSSFFEDLGFRYIGPVDGHNINALCGALNSAKMVGMPVLLHVNTVKGKGYDYAENSPEEFHGVSRFDAQTGKSAGSSECFSHVFGRALTEFAAKDKRICAVTAAMTLGTGLSDFARSFPERFYDVGIAEEHALTFCAGLTAGGCIPVFAVYSTFFQRCFDQLMHDGALQRRKLVIALDRAGFVGQDGETHQGLYDVAMMAGVPGLTVYSPATYEGVRHSLYNAFYRDPGVVVIRYPRGGEPQLPQWVQTQESGFSLYGDPLAPVTLATYGRLLGECCRGAEILQGAGIRANVLHLRQIIPLAPQAVEAAMGSKALFFFEEGARCGGIGERMASLLLERGYSGKFKMRAVENCFVAHATVAEQSAQFGLTADSMAQWITESLKG